MKSQHLQHVFSLFGDKILCADDWFARDGMHWGANEGAEGARPVIERGRGKPCPDLFLAAAREILGRMVGIEEHGEEGDAERAERAKGLVLEDAIPGVHAGKRAGMNGELFIFFITPAHWTRSVVWVPDINLLDLKHDGEYKADEVLRSLEDFLPDKWGLPPYASV